MGPQLLSRVHPNAEFVGISGTAYADLYPELFHKVQRVISLAAYGEQLWAHTFVGLLRANPTPSLAMYKRLDSASAKQAIFMAAAETVLTVRDLNCLRATMKAIQAPYKVRHRFAHHLWGFSHELPSVILLADPDAFTEMQRSGAESVLSGQSDGLMEKHRSTLRNSTFVWNAVALDEAVEEITGAITMIRLTSELIQLPAEHPTRDNMRTSLSHWPRFRESLQRIESATPQ